MSTNGTSASASAAYWIHAVSLKLPEFWADNFVSGLLIGKLILLPEELCPASHSFTTVSEL